MSKIFVCSCVLAAISVQLLPCAMPIVETYSPSKFDQERSQREAELIEYIAALELGKSDIKAFEECFRPLLLSEYERNGVQSMAQLKLFHRNDWCLRLYAKAFFEALSNYRLKKVQEQAEPGIRFIKD